MREACRLQRAPYLERLYPGEQAGCSCSRQERAQLERGRKNTGLHGPLDL